MRSTPRSPTLGLILGLIITLAAVVAYSWYITLQISGLRQLENNLADRYRKDSLQLLRIQNDLNSLGLAMRDMLANDEPYPLTAWSSQFSQIHTDLNDALALERGFAVAPRTPEQIESLSRAFQQFWNAVDRTFSLAKQGDEAAAREQIRVTLQARQASLTAAVAHQLIENNEGEEAAASRISQIYDRVQHQVYLFLAGILIAILVTSVYLIRTNRALFMRLDALSKQRSELAQKLITSQESTLRYLSRELHDEFGQILTAIGSMLGRAGKHIPQTSPVQSDLLEVRDVTQETLEKVRTLSQALHPVMLEETGLENTMDWYVKAFEKQTKLQVHYEKLGTSYPIDGAAPIQIYRILQEALNNVARHSGAQDAWVRLQFSPTELRLEIEDHGAGISGRTEKSGIGLTAMRERAELLGATLEFLQPAAGGTLVRLAIPKSRLN